MGLMILSEFIGWPVPSPHATESGRYLQSLVAPLAQKLAQAASPAGAFLSDVLTKLARTGDFLLGRGDFWLLVLFLVGICTMFTYLARAKGPESDRCR